MFIGHFAIGFASKRVAPRASLGLLLAAPLLLDLLWPILVLTGVERARIVPGDTAFTPIAFDHYPVSHSLLTVLGWAVLASAAVWLYARRTREALIVGLAVTSHWPLDLLTHRPDLPLHPGGPLVGLGLWHSVTGTIVVEGVLFAAGVWVYARTTRPRDRTGSIALWALVGLLSALYLGNVVGPAPPSVRAVAIAGLATWLFPVWGLWIDRHRFGCQSVTRVRR